MPDEFDFDGLRVHLDTADLQLVVAEREGATAYAGTALDAGDALIEELRADAMAWLAKVATARLPVQYDENTLLADHEVAISEAEIVEPQLIEVLETAARDRPGPDAGPEPRLIRLYALVSVGGERALFIRRQNPVRHLGRGVITRLLVRNRLTEAPPIFVYDGEFDLVVWQDTVLVTRDTSLDAVFLTAELRERQTREAATALAGTLRSEDAPTLQTVLAADAPFAAKLRKVHRTGHFDRVDPASWQPTITDFELGLRVEDGRLTLPAQRRGRWELIYLIEDGFVRGAATGAKYRSNSQRVWERRRVTSVGVDNGRVTSLAGAGAWSPRSASEAVEDIRGHRAEYVVEAGVELHIVQVGEDADGEYLFAGDGPNLLLALSGG